MQITRLQREEGEAGMCYTSNAIIEGYCRFAGVGDRGPNLSTSIFAHDSHDFFVGLNYL